MPLTGTQSGDASNTYPQAMKDAAKNSLYRELLDTFSPSDETQFPYLPARPATVPAQIFDGSTKHDGIGFATPYSGTAAGNTMPFSPGSYYQSHSIGTYPKVDGAGNLVTDQNNIPLVGGSINGSVSADASGRLWGFYKVYYGYPGSYGSSGSVSPMTPPAGSVMPDHINLLLQTNVYAYAFAGKAAGASGKVTSKATASIPFFAETLSLTADGDSPLDQPKRQIGGRHLVRSAVAPLDAMSGIAAVYLDGEVHTQASNGVVYDQKRTLDYEGGTRTFDTQNLAGAGTWSFVTAGVKQGNRDIILHRDNARSAWTDVDGNKHGEWTDAGGTTHGETTYSYHVYLRNDNGTDSVNGVNATQMPDYINWQTIRPTFSGSWLYTGTYDEHGFRYGWEPWVHWNWTPDETKNTKLMALCSMPFGSMEMLDSGWAGKLDPASAYNSPDGIVYNVTVPSQAEINDPLADGATFTAKYALSVHDPVDNWRLDPKQRTWEGQELVYAKAAPKAADGSPLYQPAGSTSIHMEKEKALDYLDYGHEVKLLGGLLHTAGAMTPMFIELAGLDLGPLDIGIVGLMEASSFAIGEWDSKAPMDTVDASTTFTDLQNDMAIQQRINNGAQPTPDPTTGAWPVLAPTEQRFDDPAFYTFLAGLSQQDQQKYCLGGGDSDPNGNMNGSLEVTAEIVQHVYFFPYIGDQYDTGGMLVDADGKTPLYARAIIRYAGACEAVRKWRLNKAALPLGSGH